MYAEGKRKTLEGKNGILKTVRRFVSREKVFQGPSVGTERRKDIKRKKGRLWEDSGSCSSMFLRRPR